MKQPVRITITGAAGQIGYQLAFRIASGQMLGANQPVILQLLEIPPALPALNGVVMELDDCAFSTLAGIVGTDDPNVAFKDSDYALFSAIFKDLVAIPLIRPVLLQAIRSPKRSPELAKAIGMLFKP